MMKGLKCGAPRWLIDILGLDWNEGETGPVRQMSRLAGFDHVRTYTNKVVISQPYYVDGAELGELLVKLAGRGIGVRVHGTSPYNPGQTFSLTIWRKEDTELAEEIVNKMLQSVPQAAEADIPTMTDWT